MGKADVLAGGDLRPHMVGIGVHETVFGLRPAVDQVSDHLSGHAVAGLAVSALKVDGKRMAGILAREVFVKSN